MGFSLVAAALYLIMLPQCPGCLSPDKNEFSIYVYLNDSPH